MTDLEKFIDTYEQFGIELQVNETEEGYTRIILGHEAYDGKYNVTESEEFGGYGGFCTEITFGVEGNFLSQNFWE